MRVPTHPVLHERAGGSSGDQRFEAFEVKRQLLVGRLLPGGGDLAAAVAVADDLHSAGVVETDRLCGRPPAGQVAASEPAPVPTVVLVSQPDRHPPPRVGAQVVEGPRTDPVSEVGAPAAQHRVEPVKQLVERLIRPVRVICLTLPITA